MKYKRVERRKFIRFDLDTNVRFRFFDNIDEHLKGKAKNLSGEGVCVVTEKEMPRDKDIELDISIPGKKGAARVHGKVIWTHRIKGVDKRVPDHYEAGIKLYTVDKADENTLLKYYCERMVDNLSKYVHI
jgi:c-di-GMP-binding flagellar brake protein YcgR